MRKTLVLALLLPLAALIFLLAGRADTASAKLTPEQLREDFSVFRNALEEGHGGLYRYTNKAEMDRIFDRAGKALDHPMDVLELYRVLTPVIAGIKCGHTRVVLPDALRQEISARALLLPLLPKVLDQRVYVLRDLVNADRRLAGREILSINGIPTPQILATMLAATPGDGDVLTGKRFTIDRWRFSENLVTLLGLSAPWEITVAGRAPGRQETLRLAGTELPKLRGLAEAQGRELQFDGPTRLEFVDGGRIASLRIAEFSGDLESFFRKSFAEMQEKKTAVLLIDLRNNGGGVDHLGKLLFSYFVDTPFDYYSDVYVSKMTYDLERYATRRDPVMTSMFSRGKDGRYHAVNHPNWGPQRPSRPTFRGKIIVLINGGSFSTTTEFLTHMQARKLATFVGQESAGGYYGNTAGFMPIITLPNSRLDVRVPLVAYYIAVAGGQPAARGVAPDYPVQYTIEDVTARKDKEMEVALRLARQP
jgi:hypothetical protein